MGGEGGLRQGWGWKGLVTRGRCRKLKTVSVSVWMSHEEDQRFWLTS